jgi:hypothetical protein
MRMVLAGLQLSNLDAKIDLWDAGVGIVGLRGAGHRR